MLQTNITVLDVSVHIRQDKIFSTIFQKSTGSNCYASSHTVHIMDSIIYPQFIRYKRVCTRNTDFTEHINGLTTHLVHNAYPVKVIRKHWNKVANILRMIFYNQKQQASKNCLHLEQTYHPSNVPTNKTVMNERKWYCDMPTAKHLFSCTSLCAYRQPPNLKQLLVKTRISTTPTFTGNNKMHEIQMQTCNIIDTRPSLNISGTDIDLRPGHYNCKSSIVI